MTKRVSKFTSDVSLEQRLLRSEERASALPNRLDIGEIRRRLTQRRRRRRTWSVAIAGLAGLLLFSPWLVGEKSEPGGPSMAIDSGPPHVDQLAENQAPEVTDWLVSEAEREINQITEELQASQRRINTLMIQQETRRLRGRIRNARHEYVRAIKRRAETEYLLKLTDAY
ncbi:hypothetical protein SH139x_005719 [Planctomycetaceae bacterium SH139]